MPYSKVKEALLSAVSVEERLYLEESFSKIKSAYKIHFNQVFSTLNRKLPNSRDQIISLHTGMEELIIEDWELIKLIRIYLISLVKDEKNAYCQFFDRLFEYSDMQELVALYSSLTILDYPDYWVQHCQDGIRSNIGLVQEAIIEKNKYPYLHLEQNAWNQLVLKSFFTGKNVLKIYGLFQRNNQALAESIVDYIYERHSAKRNIHPVLWLLSKDYLPARAMNILVETFQHTSEKLEQSILFHVILENKAMLGSSIYVDDLASQLEIISFSQSVLDAYKNGELCVQN